MSIYIINIYYSIIKKKKCVKTEWPNFFMILNKIKKKNFFFYPQIYDKLVNKKKKKNMVIKLK